MRIYRTRHPVEGSVTEGEVWFDVEPPENGAVIHGAVHWPDIGGIAWITWRVDDPVDVDFADMDLELAE